MSRHICCHRNYVLCSVINLLYCCCTVIPQLTKWNSHSQQGPLYRDGGTDCSTPRYAPCSVTTHKCTSQFGGCGRVLVFMHGCNAYPTVWVSLYVHVRLPLCTCEWWLSNYSHSVIRQGHSLCSHLGSTVCAYVPWILLSRFFNVVYFAHLVQFTAVTTARMQWACKLCGCTFWDSCSAKCDHWTLQ